MGMGTWFISQTADPDSCVVLHKDRYCFGDIERAYLAQLTKFMDKWDEELKISGITMRFTAHGPVRHDW
jgi:hypothetical protein